MKLSQLKKGESAYVKQITGGGAESVRISQMLLIGERITFVRLSPHGDSMLIKTQFSTLIFSKKSASLVEVEK